MPARIIKTVLKPGEANSVPAGKIIAVAFQNRQLTAWTEATDPRGPAIQYVVIVETGDEVPANLVHVGTAVSPTDVFHVYGEPASD